MKKASVVSILFLLFFLAACVDEKVVIPITGNSSALPLLDTMTSIAKTIEVIAQTATAYSIPPTPTDTPTSTPDPGAVSKVISDSINNQLISTFGARISVVDVKFGPIGAQNFTNLYIEINCAGDNSAVCPTTNVIIAVMDACIDKKKRILENVPSTTQLLTITIFDPLTLPKVVEINWSDVLAYINGDVPGEEFSKLIHYVEY